MSVNKHFFVIYSLIFVFPSLLYFLMDQRGSEYGAIIANRITLVDEFGNKRAILFSENENARLVFFDVDGQVEMAIGSFGEWSGLGLWDKNQNQRIMVGLENSASILSLWNEGSRDSIGLRVDEERMGIGMSGGDGLRRMGILADLITDRSGVFLFDRVGNLRVDLSVENSGSYFGLYNTGGMKRLSLGEADNEVWISIWKEEGDEYVIGEAKFGEQEGSEPMESGQ